MTGINNVLQERYDVTGPYREIVRNFTTWWKGATIVVQSLLPVEYSWISNDMIRDINRRLEGIARDAGAHYLDVYGAFVDAEGTPKAGLLSDDGVHLANKGYEVWATVVERFLGDRR
jgi:lysophospholipase L1-like esterase